MKILIQKAKNSDLEPIAELLVTNELPIADIREKHVQMFIGRFNDEMVATIGIEKYGSQALLRSLAVKHSFRNNKIGGAMVKHVIGLCLKENVENLYSFTTAAEKYFLKFGFKRIERDEVPDTIKNTLEFRELCPESAAVLHKKMNLR